MNSAIIHVIRDRSWTKASCIWDIMRDAFALNIWVLNWGRDWTEHYQYLALCKTIAQMWLSQLPLPWLMQTLNRTFTRKVNSILSSTLRKSPDTQIQNTRFTYNWATVFICLIKKCNNENDAVIICSPLCCFKPMICRIKIWVNNLGELFL